jgi:hypothetical protein
MAGDWIKIELVTPDKPEIDLLAEMLDVSVNEVLGALVRLWIWADCQTINGNAVSVTKNAIDRHSGVSGFAVALLDDRVGWLVESPNGGFIFPNFERHNGQTAKTRALTAKRVAKHKAQNGNAEVTPTALAREEKRREENNPLKSPTGDGYSEAFERWWMHYPKKVQKQAAYRAWKKATKRASKATLEAAAAEYGRSPRGMGEYCLNPATWLNGGSWDDDRGIWQTGGDDSIKAIAASEYDKAKTRRLIEETKRAKAQRGGAA